MNIIKTIIDNDYDLIFMAALGLIISAAGLFFEKTIKEKIIALMFFIICLVSLALLLLRRELF